MATHIYDHPTPCFSELRTRVRVFSERALVLGLALALLLCGRAESEATLTPPAALGQYALLSNGSFTANHSTIEGNAWLKSGSLTSSNGSVFQKNFSYQTGSLNLNNNSNKVYGVTSQNADLETTVNTVAEFSQNISKLGVTTPALNGDLSGKITLTGNGSVNVVDINAAAHGKNFNGSLSLSGGANDIFYINVFSNMDLTGLLLSGGVEAKNVFLNIVSGQNAKISGEINGTVLAFNPQNKKATSLEINATIYGDVAAGDLKLSDGTTIKGIAAQSTVAMAPEASSMAAMSLFAIFVLASSSTRFWKNKLQRQQA